MLTRFEWDVQTNYTEINSWNDLNRRPETRSGPPSKFPDKTPRNQGQSVPVPAPRIIEKKRSRQKLAEQRQQRREERTDGQSQHTSEQTEANNPPRVVKKASKPRANQQEPTSSSSGRINPSRVAKKKCEKLTKEIQDFEKIPIGGLQSKKSGKAKKKTPLVENNLQEPTLSEDDEDPTMFDPNATGYSTESSDEGKPTKNRRKK